MATSDECRGVRNRVLGLRLKRITLDRVYLFYYLLLEPFLMHSFLPLTKFNLPLFLRFRYLILPLLPRFLLNLLFPLLLRLFILVSLPPRSLHPILLTFLILILRIGFRRLFHDFLRNLRLLRILRSNSLQIPCLGLLNIKKLSINQIIYPTP